MKDLLKGESMELIVDENINIVEAETSDDDEFQVYYYLSGKRVEQGVIVGIEILNPRTNKWELKLLNDIRFG